MSGAPSARLLTFNHLALPLAIARNLVFRIMARDGEKMCVIQILFHNHKSQLLFPVENEIQTLAPIEFKLPIRGNQRHLVSNGMRNNHMIRRVLVILYFIQN